MHYMRCHVLSRYARSLENLARVNELPGDGLAHEDSPDAEREAQESKSAPVEVPPPGFEVVSHAKWQEFPSMRRANLLYSGHVSLIAGGIWVYPGALTEEEMLLLEPDFEDTEVEERKGNTYSMPVSGDE